MAADKSTLVNEAAELCLEARDRLDAAGEHAAVAMLDVLLFELGVRLSAEPDASPTA